jgi:hypothetical protein
LAGGGRTSGRGRGGRSVLGGDRGLAGALTTAGGAAGWCLGLWGDVARRLVLRGPKKPGAAAGAVLCWCRDAGGSWHGEDALLSLPPWSRNLSEHRAPSTEHRAPRTEPGPARAAARSPGLLAGAADPVLLLLLVEAAALADAVLAVHDLALGVEEGEGRAAVDAEVL